MTSQGMAARNRANAQKSTGPRTAAGKATVAQNARSHGATSKPDPASIAPWLGVILDDPDLRPADLFAKDDRMRLALALAEAEVKVSAALTSLERFERGDDTPSEVTREFREFVVSITGELAEEVMTKLQYRAGLSLLKRLGNEISNETVLEGKRHKLLRRYLREAQSHRGKAFQAWLACLREETREVRKAD
tara:strand:- start:641 stop:1216 length:576 start_codon:yes stop_codon:yes gene_type:complete